MIDPELDKYHTQSRAELIADVIDDTEKVARALEIQRAPDISNRRFLFELTDEQYVLPPSIKASIDPTSQAVQLGINIEENRLIEPGSKAPSDPGEVVRTAEVSIEIQFSGERDFVIFITPNPDSAALEPFVASMVFVDDLGHSPHGDDSSPELPLFEPLERAELNSMIASIIAPNKTHDYRMYAKMDLTSPKTVHHIAEALEEKADSTICEYDYFTGDLLSLDGDQLRFIKVDGKPATAMVQRSLSRGAISADISLDRSMLPPEDDLTDSFEGIRMYSKDINGVSNERDVDFDVLVSIHDFLGTLKKTMFEPEHERLDHEKANDDSSTMNIDDLHEFNQETGRDS